MYVAHYKGRVRLFNRLVSWWFNGPYSHTELVLWTDKNGLSRCASSSLMDGGVRAKWIKLDPDHWTIEPVDGDIDYAMQWLKEHYGDGYDLLGLLGIVLRRSPGARNKVFCSEAVAAMLGFPEPWRFDPMALWAALSRRVPPATMETRSNG